MTIKKKLSKEKNLLKPNIQDVISQVISRGGKTKADELLPVKEDKQEVRFTLRLPLDLIQRIDDARKLRPGIVSRNQWILEVISNAVET